jgi:hypothetical protein
MTLPAPLTQAQLGCDNITWFHHTLERVNFWQRKSDLDPSSLGAQGMVAAWERQRVIAWNKLSQRERRLITKWS